MKRIDAILAVAIVALAISSPASAEASGSLKRVTAKALFRETAAIGPGRPDYLGCARVTKYRFRCRAKWTQDWTNPFGQPVTDIWKVRGYAKRNGYYIKVKAKVIHTVYDSDGKHQYPRTNWKLYYFG